MKRFLVNTRSGSEIEFNFPTSLNELTEDVLKDIVSNIKVADNYALIALCYSDRLSNIIMTARTKKKEAKIKVTPLFVKAGKTDIDFINNAKCGQRVITTQSQLSLGIHINVPGNKLTIEYFSFIVEESSNRDLYPQELANPDQSECIFLEFKLVPICDITGLIDNTKPISAISNTFVRVNNKANC